MNNFNPLNHNSTPPLPNNINKYWNDGSYVEVLSESQAQKVWYGSSWRWEPDSVPPQWVDHCDHSAITTTTPGRYKSKWGCWPLYEHDYNACPYYTYSSRKFYKLNSSVSGDNLLCTSNKSYTLTNNPSGTISWSTSPAGYISPSNGTGNPAIIHASSGTVFGYCTITFNLTTCGNASYQITSNPFWVGKLESTYVTGTAAVCPNSIYTYTAQVPGGHSSSYSYSWTYPGNWYRNSQYQNNITLQTPQNPNYGTVRVSVTNQCGSSGYSGITVYPRQGCGGYFSLFPNPASNEVTISINDLSVTSEDISNTELLSADIVSINPINYSIKVYNSQGVLALKFARSGTTSTIPISSLQEGNYIIEVTDGRISDRNTLIIKHN